MKRVHWMVTAAAVVVVCAGAAIAVYLRSAPPLKATFVVFGGITQVELRAVTPAAAADAFGEIGQVLQRDQREWHPWEMSDLMRLNAAIAQGQAQTVPPGLAELVRRAKDGYRRTDGLFNPAIGGLIDLWGFHTSEYPITSPRPPPEAIAKLLANVPRMDDIEVDADGTIRSVNRSIELDLNGLAEGFAAEQIVEVLRRRGIGNALINAGGDVLALGDAGGRPWRVAISSPGNSTFAAAQISGHEALFSSGNYNKYREVDGHRWGHILDPRSGEPAQGTAAVSVIHPDAVTADLAATTFMIGGIKEFPRLARNLGVVCAVLVGEDGTTWITPAMHRRITFEKPPQNLRLTEDFGADCAAAGTR